MSSSASPFQQAVAGAFGGIVATTAVYPLDIVKTRLQVPNTPYRNTLHALIKIARDEGIISGLYAGLSSEYLKSALQNFVYFYVYSALKKLYHRYGVAPIFNLRRIWLTVYRVIRSFFRMRSSNQNKTTTDANTNTSTEGVGTDTHSQCESNAAVGTGTGTDSNNDSDSDCPNVIESGSDSAGPGPGPGEIDIVSNLAIGMLAGASTQLFTNPLTVVQTRIMSGAVNANDGLVSILTRIVQHEGVWSLFRGIVPSLILTSNPAIQFAAYDRIKAWWERQLASSTDSDCDYESDTPQTTSALALFLMGAYAKSVATVVTYPYIMAKMRLQWKGGAGAPQYNGTVDVLRQIMASDGVVGLWSGLRAQILKSVSGAAVMYMAKEKIQSTVTRVFQG
jgi:Mitochondrial carrier protein